MASGMLRRRFEAIGSRFSDYHRPMIHVDRNANEVRVRVTTERRPLIYLDQCAIYELARSGDLHDRFQRFFETQGELLLSTINLIELSQLQGASLARAKTFLDEVVGAAWIPIEFDAMTVIVRELSGQVEPSPAISDFLAYEACATSGEATISKLIEPFRYSPEQRREFEAAKEELRRQIEEIRKNYIADPSSLDRKYPLVPRTPPTKTLSVASRVFRVITERARGPEHFLWAANDAEDFTHAIIGLAHAEVVVLDGKWAPRAKGLAPAGVFSCGEIPAFLSWCEEASSR